MPLYQIDQKIPRVAANAWIAPDACIIGDVHLADQVSIWWQAILRGDNDPIVIGARTNIQDASILHTDSGAPLTIGSDVTVGHRVMLHGCTIGNGALIGIGAIVLNHAVIGENCLVGAGTLIPEGKVFPPGSLILGSPGKLVRMLSTEEISAYARGSHHYVENAQCYAKSMRII